MARKIISCLFISLSLIACGSTQTKETEQKATKIEYVEHIFPSKYYDIFVSVPSTWSISQPDMMEMMSEAGKEAIAGGDELKRQMLESTKSRTENVFSAFEYEVGAPVQFNSNVISVVEDVSMAPGVKRGKDYLFHVRTMFENSDIPYSFEDRVGTTDINGHSYDFMTTTLGSGKSKIVQVYYATLVDRNIIGFVTTYGAVQGPGALTPIIESIKIEAKEYSPILEGMSL